MGGGQSVQIQCEEMREDEWQEQEHERLFGRIRTLRNRRTGAMVDEYHLSWASRQEFEFYLKSFHWRARRRTPVPVVSSMFLRQAARSDFCTQKFAASVFLEHVGVRLSQLEEVPLGDALYVLGEALEGFRQLYHHSGYFRIKEELICVERTGRVKVWVNADLSRNYPDCDTDCGRNQKDEVNMVEQLIEIVSASIDPQEVPTPSLMQFFDLVRKREVVDIGFEYASILAIEFSKLHQVRIPERFETVLELICPKNQPPHLQLQKNYSVSNFGQTLPSSIDLPPARHWSPRLNPFASMPCIHPPSNSTSRQSQHNHLPEPIYPHNMHSFATPHADSLVSQRFGQAQQSLRLEQLNSRRVEESSGGSRPSANPKLKIPYNGRAQRALR